MNILFVHQNFPGQFKHLAPALVRAGHHVKSMAIDGAGLPEVEMLRYRPARGSSKGIHPFAQEFETKMIRGEACAQAAIDAFGEPDLDAVGGSLAQLATALSTAYPLTEFNPSLAPDGGPGSR